MSSIDPMLTFVEVVNANGFASAARKLGITPTAVSKQIKVLEQELQQTLLYRTTRNLSLTEFGEHFYQQCVELKNKVEQIKTFAHSKQEIPQGRIRIMCSTYIAKPLLSQLCQFYQRYPRIELDIDLSERVPDVEREGIDVLIGYTPVVLSGVNDRLRQKKLFDSHYLLVAAPSYLALYGEPKTLEALQQHRLINHSVRKPNNLVEFKNGDKIFFKSPHLLLNSGVALVEACCQGVGICQALPCYVQDKLATGELVALLPDHPLNEVGIYIYYQYSQYEQPHIRAFINFVCETMSQL